MKKKKEQSRVATIITQYTLYGEPEIKKVSDVLEKLTKNKTAAIKRNETRSNMFKGIFKASKRKSRRISLKKH